MSKKSVAILLAVLLCIKLTPISYAHSKEVSETSYYSEIEETVQTYLTIHTL